MLALILAALTGSGDLFLVEGDLREAGPCEDASVLFVDPSWFLCTAAAPPPDGIVLLEGPVDLGRLALVHLSSPDGAEWLDALGATLLVRGDVALVLLDGDRPAFLSPPGIRLVQGLRPLRSGGGTPVPAVPADGYVEDIVAAVSQDSLLATIQHLEDYGTRLCILPQYDEAADWVDTWFGLHWIPSYQQHFTFYGDDMANVVAEIEGQVSPDSIYIICGHLDSITWPVEETAPGADDNASGSAAVIEAARVMAPYSFKYTVRFICFGAEEVGLVGSQIYADSVAAAGDVILGVINIDMMLYAPPGADSLWIPYDDQSQDLADAVLSAMNTYVPGLEVVTEYDPSATYSDHSSFWSVGYPALLGIEYAVDDNPFYHSETDLLANYVQYWPFGTDCARGAIAALASLAQPLGPSGVGGSVAGDFRIAGISPNPASSSAVVELAGFEYGTRLDVLDLQGRVRASTTPDDWQAGLALDALPAGVYLVRAVSPSGPTDSARLVLLD